MRRTLKNLAVLLSLGLPIPALANDKVTVQLDFIIRGGHAMFFVAQKQGLFAKNGIDIAEINTGTGSLNTMRQVGSGTGDFGFGDFPTLVIARSQTVPVVGIAVVNEQSPLGMIALATAPLKTPKDMEGRSVGLSPAGSTLLFFKAFANANHLDQSKIDIHTVNPPAQTAFILRQVDTIPGYIDAEIPEIEAHTGGPGTLSFMLGSDWGVTAYGSGLFTTDKMIAAKPDLVKRFVAAYVAAFGETIRHPDAAVDAIIDAHPELAKFRPVYLEQLQADIARTFTNAATKEHGLGYMPDATSHGTISMLVEQKMIPAPIDPAAAFNNNFLPTDAPKM
jgi:NitT/TauT family transport system substrate-binding protein